MKLNSAGNDCTERRRRRLDNKINETYDSKIELEKDNKTFSDSENKNDVQYLESPIKLLEDSREYRTIKLKNGLTALLISDSQNEIETELNEDFIEQKNAYCSLCINVGSFSDPPHAQGLAHLLEHVLSMGSKKYPQENEYDAFISNRWGTNNAFTEHERTTYSFTILDKYLLAAMDRFAHTFIDPLITKDAVFRERQSVESEFKLKQQMDSCRKGQLKHSFARHNHPASKFPLGNLITLDKNIDIDELYIQNYTNFIKDTTVPIMTLAVLSTKSLDTLEQYVKVSFSDVPVNHLPSDDFSIYKGIESFDNVKFRKLYYIKTIRDTSEIELNWVMPPMQHLYKSKPWEYVNWLLVRTGKGSLFNYLNKKRWCIDMKVENYKSFNHTSMYYLLTMTVNLFDEGYANLEEVLNSIFSYINLLKQEGVQKEIFDYICQMKKNNCKSNFGDSNFKDKVEAYIEYLSQNMQYYNPSDYIHGDDLIFEYDPEAIQSCFDNLNADNVNIIISSKKFGDSETDKIEPWYQTKYSVKEIPKQWIEQWKDIDPLVDFNLSLKKNCSPTQTSKTVDNPNLVMTIPIKIQYKDIEVWYKKISENRHSEFSMYGLHLINPLCDKSAFHSTANMMLVSIIAMCIESDYITRNLRVIPSVKGIIIKNKSCTPVSKKVTSGT